MAHLITSQELEAYVYTSYSYLYLKISITGIGRGVGKVREFTIIYFFSVTPSSSVLLGERTRCLVRVTLARDQVISLRVTLPKRLQGFCSVEMGTSDIDLHQIQDGRCKLIGCEWFSSHQNPPLRPFPATSHPECKCARKPNHRKKKKSWSPLYYDFFVSFVVNESRYGRTVSQPVIRSCDSVRAAVVEN